MAYSGEWKADCWYLPLARVNQKGLVTVRCEHIVPLYVPYLDDL